MIPLYGAALGNHLWQSTLFAAVAWLLTLALKKNRASIRYWIWFAASLKFLIPLSLLMSFGSYLHVSAVPGIVQSNLSAFESFSRPLVAPASLSISKSASVASLHAARSSAVPWFLMAPWFAGFVAVALSQHLRRRRFRALIGEARFLNKGREVEALRRVQSHRGCREPIHLALSLSALEPGVWGIFTHLLLLPADISGRLDDAQLEAVLAHEVAHIERRDNLFAAVHMMVEMLFWFHPLVWWIGSRMVEERERACDGDVLQSGSDAEAYAGAILKVCQYYLASPLSTVSGITGSNLKKRIEDIMTNRSGEKLSLVRKLLLVTAGAVIVAAPILAGVMQAGQAVGRTAGVSPLVFEVASVKINMSGDRPYLTQYLPGGRFTAKNVPIPFLIIDAYGSSVYRVAPSPGFEKAVDPRVMNNRYDIEAMANKSAIPPDTPAKDRNEKLRLMLQSLLADRFKLGAHLEVKDGPVYALVVAKNGPKLQKASVSEQDCAARASDPSDSASCHVSRGGQGQGIHGEAIDMSDLAHALSNFSDRPIIDKTGLSGLYNIQTSGWVDMRNLSRPPRPAETEAQRAEDLVMADPSRPTVFAVLDQLGLKLEQQTAPIETLFIDHLEAPSEN